MAREKERVKSYVTLKILNLCDEFNNNRIQKLMQLKAYIVLKLAPNLEFFKVICLEWTLDILFTTVWEMISDFCNFSSLYYYF